MENVEQSQLVMKQFLLAMTINFAGPSAHSCIAVDNNINDNNIKIITALNVMENFRVLVTTISNALAQTNLFAPCSYSNN